MRSPPRRSYHHGLGERHLTGATIGEVLRAVVDEHAERMALVSVRQGIRWSFRELWERTGGVARGLSALGVTRGDRVGIWSTNNAEWVLVQLATARLGAVLVNVNPAWRKAELEHGLRKSGIHTLVAIPGFKSSDYEGDLSRLCADSNQGDSSLSAAAPQLRNVVIYDPSNAEETPDREDHRFLSWPRMLEGGHGLSDDPVAEREAELEPDDPINIQFTSGTTGYPKAVVLSHHNILNNALLTGDLLQVVPDDRLCVPVPFYHCFGMVVANLLTLTRGACLVIPSEYFDAGATLQAIEAWRCTLVHGVPTMFVEALEHPDFPSRDLSSLRSGVMAGAPCPPELVRRVRNEMGIADLRIGYGMTEVSPVTHLTRFGDEGEVATHTVGTSMPHLEVRVVDVETDRVVDRGDQGEIEFRGYQVMRGYLDDVVANREAIDEVGWLRSGDLGVMEADGYLRITGRRKDMIVRGGENVYPAEVEAQLFEHDAVADVAVFGLPDPRLGEEVAAWIRLHDGLELTAEEVRAWAKERMAFHKVPRHIWFVDEFPATVSGKIKKFRIREIAEEWLEEEAQAPVGEGR